MIVKLKCAKARKVGKAKPQDMAILHTIMSGLESGEIKEIAVVGIKKDGGMIRGWSKSTKPNNAFHMIGIIEALKEEYLRISIGESK